MEYFLEVAISSHQNSHYAISVGKNKLWSPISIVAMETPDGVEVFVDDLMSREALIVITQSGIITQANDSFTSLFGYLLDEVLGQPLKKVLPQFDPSVLALPDTYRKQMNGESYSGVHVPVTIELYRKQTEDGTTFVGRITHSQINNNRKFVNIATKLAKGKQQHALANVTNASRDSEEEDGSTTSSSVKKCQSSNHSLSKESVRSDPEIPGPPLTSMATPLSSLPRRASSPLRDETLPSNEKPPKMEPNSSSSVQSTGISPDVTPSRGKPIGSLRLTNERELGLTTRASSATSAVGLGIKKGVSMNASIQDQRVETGSVHSKSSAESAAHSEAESKASTRVGRDSKLILTWKNAKSNPLHTDLKGSLNIAMFLLLFLSIVVVVALYLTRPSIEGSKLLHDLTIITSVTSDIFFAAERLHFCRAQAPSSILCTNFAPDTEFLGLADSLSDSIGRVYKILDSPEHSGIFKYSTLISLTQYVDDNSAIASTFVAPDYWQAIPRLVSSVRELATLQGNPENNRHWKFVVENKDAFISSSSTVLENLDTILRTLWQRENYINMAVLLTFVTIALVHRHFSTFDQFLKESLFTKFDYRVYCSLSSGQS
jgi:PAS domain S-box-containing protein